MNLPVSKNVEMKKEKKKKKKKKETKKANSIHTMFNRNFHFVSRTVEGEIQHVSLLARLCLAGGVPIAGSKEAFPNKTGNSKRANETTDKAPTCLAQCV